MAIPSELMSLYEAEDDALWDTDRTEIFNLTPFSRLLTQALPTVVAPIAAQERLPKPVVAIQYGIEFAHVASYVRGMLALGEASPRLLATLAIGLKHLPANYTLWKRRRDIILNAKAFEAACSFGLGLSPEKWRPYIAPPAQDELILLPMAERAVRWKKYEDECHKLRDYSYAPHLDTKLFLGLPACVDPAAKELDAVERFAALWAPIGETVLPPLRDSGACAPFEQVVEVSEHDDATVVAARRHPKTVVLGRRVYDVWHAVAWEMRSTRYTAVTIGKSFQTWNHRKELLIAAATRTANSVLGAAHFRAHDLMSTPSHAEAPDAPTDRLALRFSDFDDRILTGYVLKQVDAKNYHAWSHRAWFVMFSGLLEVDEAFEYEMQFTTKLIDDDVFNNSAWSHRMLVLRQRLLRSRGFPADALSQPEFAELVASQAVLVFPRYFPKQFVMDPRCSPSAREAASLLTPLVPRDEALRWLQSELEFAEEAMLHEPRNECPFTHCVGLVRLYSEFLAPNENSDEAMTTLSLFAADVRAVLERVDTATFALHNAEVSMDGDAVHDSAEEGRARGSTEHLRRTHVDLHRTASLVHLNQVVGRLGVDADPTIVAARKEESHRWAVRLQEIDPVRRKYWLSVELSAQQ
jgi:hypothetical protein